MMTHHSRLPVNATSPTRCKASCILHTLTAMDNVSTVSVDAPNFDKNTPTVSENIGQFVLNDTDRDVLNRCDYFAETLQNITRDIRQNGRTDMQLPAYSKLLSELLRIMGVNKQKKILMGSELHEYLKSKLVHERFDTELKPPPLGVMWTLEEFLTLMKQGNGALMTMKAKTLRVCFNYGLWLNLAYKVWVSSKGAGLVRETWAKWLSTNIGISAPYARLLRDLSDNFYQYKIMHNLSISMKDLYKMRYQIIYMLENDQSIANFWLGN